MNQLEHAAQGELSAGDVARIGAALESSIAPNTAKAYRAALERFAAWLAGRPATDRTVAAYVAHLMEDGKAPATIKQAAAAAAAEGTTAGLRDAALVRTMSDALLRASEVAAIDTRDITREKDGGRLAIPRSKTDQDAEGAVTYLTPATMTALDNWLRAAAAAWTASGAGGAGGRRCEGPGGAGTRGRCFAG